MSKTVHCPIVGREAEALEKPPYPGELGARIQREISKDGWNRWLEHQRTLINEHRLSPIDRQHREYLEREMEKFFFEGGSEKPAGFIPPPEG